MYVGDDYSNMKVLSLIIISCYSGRGIKKIFIFICYMEISISIKRGEVRLNEERWQINVGINEWSSVVLKGVLHKIS